MDSLGIVNFVAFVSLALVMNATPGLDTVFIITRALEGGQLAGFISSAGVSTGILIHTTLSALGLSLILSSSTLAFSLLKLAGAGYLLFLAAQTLFTKSKLIDITGIDDSNTTVKRSSKRTIYSQAILCNVLNPKAVIFFVALLPQFVNANFNPVAVPFFVLGTTIALSSFVWGCVLAAAAGWAKEKLLESSYAHCLTNKVAALIYAALGFSILFGLQ